MFGRLLLRMTPRLGVDLGTSSTRIGALGDRVLVDEPSVVAVSRDTGRILSGGGAVGHLARQLQGRTPESIEVVSPLVEGGIAHYEMCAALLRHLFYKVLPTGPHLKPRVLIAVPGSITPVQRRAVYGTLHQAGAGQVFLIDKAKAAAIGASLPVTEPGANLVCDIGGGTTEAAVVSFAGNVASCSIREAGDRMDRAIVDYLRQHFSLRIGMATAQRLKQEIGSAMAMDNERTAEVHGLDAVGGLPRRATVTSEEAREALQEVLDTIVDALHDTLDALPPDLAADLMERGMVLCGGGAKLRHLDLFLRERLGMPVRVAEEPQRAVIRGVMLCLGHFDRWRPLFESSDDAY